MVLFCIQLVLLIDSVDEFLVNKVNPFVFVPTDRESGLSRLPNFTKPENALNFLAIIVAIKIRLVYFQIIHDKRIRGNNLSKLLTNKTLTRYTV